MNLLSSILAYTARQIAALRAKDDSQDTVVSGINTRVGTAEGNITTLTTRFDNNIAANSNSKEVLYSGIVVMDGTITLSKSISNFDFIDIEYQQTGRGGGSDAAITKRIPAVAGIYWVQDFAMDYTSTQLNFFEQKLTLSDTSLVAESNYNIDATADGWVKNRGAYIFQIKRVLGIKMGSASSTELTDIRVGDDNVTYTSAGEAVRTQFANVKSILGKNPISKTITLSKMANADSGEIWDSSSYSIIEASLTYHKRIHIVTHTYSSAGICFYDSDDAFISSIKNMSTADNYLYDDVVDVPTNATKIIVSSFTPTRLDVVIESTVEQDIDGLLKYVDAKDESIKSTTTEEINEVSDELDNFENAIAEYVLSQNKYNGTYSDGYYVNQANGTLSDNSTYGASDFIKVSNISNKIVLSMYGNFYNTCRYALYSAPNESSYLRGAVIGESDVLHDDVNNVYYSVIDVTGANYIRFSAAVGNFVYISDSKLMLAFGDTSLPYAPYVPEGWRIKDVGGLDVYESAVVGKYQPSAYADTLANGTNLKISGSNSIKKNKVYHFRANIDSNFDKVYCGHGEGDYSLYFKIDDTNITFMSNGSESTALPHGLTLDTYIDLVIIANNTSVGQLVFNTLGGTYTRAVQLVNGYKGEVFMRPSGCSLTNAFVGFSCSDFRQPIWMFGDSYFTHTSNNRWPYWLVQWGFDRCLLNAFPGENSTEGIATFNSFVPSCGVPRYAVWCLGMNDPDGSSSVSTSWKAAVEQFILVCEQNGITPILATIPNVPNYSNYYKNEYVRASGYRYIDFAKAVGAEEVGSHWYDGALSTDNVHPSEIGARMLCLRAIEDIPELTLGNI